MSGPSDPGHFAPIGITDFWPQVLNAKHRLLGLDYDGTLAPFATDPMQARPLVGVIELLRDLARSKGTGLAIISGRPVSEVVILLSQPPVAIVGCHGFEYLPVGGRLETRHPLPLQNTGLGLAQTAVRRNGHGHRLEVKVASLALHTRGLPEDIAAAIERNTAAVWSGIAQQHELECRRFNGGLEIRCTGWNKGEALAMLHARQPGDTLAVYIGDDETDEDAFAFVQGRGLGIRVGRLPATTAAAGTLPDCQAVVELLCTWRSLLA